MDAGQLHGDLVAALAGDDGLGNAELVDAVPHDLDRAVEIVLRDLPPLRRLRLEDDLEAALEIEAQGRRAEERQHDDPGDGGQDRGEDEQVAAHSWTFSRLVPGRVPLLGGLRLVRGDGLSRLRVDRLALLAGLEPVELLGRYDARDRAPGDGDAHVIIDLQHHALGIELDDLPVDARRR